MSSPIADRLRALRRARNLTIDALASRAGVSRSMISLIERGESSPTANILDKLAAALGVTLASLFAGASPVSPLSRRAAQPEWTDPGTGYRRRNLSPPGFLSRLELVEVVLQPGMRVTYDTATREPAFDQQVWLIEGQLHLTVGTDRHELAEGDCLAMRLDRPTTFHNPGQRPSRHLVALCPAAP